MASQTRTLGQCLCWRAPRFVLGCDGHGQTPDTIVSTSPLIRKAVRHDAEAVLQVRRAAIRHQCAGHYPKDVLDKWTDGELTDQFAEAVEGHGHVATVDGRVVATGMLDLESGKIDALFVSPTHMRRGVGKAMLRHLECLASASGLARVSLDSTLNAAPFYRAHGFSGDSVATYASPRGISLACVPMVKVLARAD